MKFKPKYIHFKYAMLAVLVLFYILLIASAGIPAASAFFVKTVAIILFSLAHLYALQLIRKLFRRIKWSSTSSQEYSQPVESYSSWQK